jgi:hypothetical protein
LFLLTTIAGLPAHALLVHAAVVLVPLAAIGLVVTGWKAAWRKAYSLPVAIIAVAGTGFALLAKQTGGTLERTVRDAAGQRVRFGEHPEQGDSAFFFAMIFGLTAIGFWAIDRYHERLSLPKWTPWAGYAWGVVSAGLALTTMVIAGHSGAKLVWKDVGTYATAR